MRREDGAFGKPGVRTRSYDVSPKQARAALAKVAEYKAHAPAFSFARRDCGQFAADVLKAASISDFAGVGIKRPAEVYRQVQAPAGAGAQAKGAGVQRPLAPHVQAAVSAVGRPMAAHVQASVAAVGQPKLYAQLGGDRWRRTFRPLRQRSENRPTCGQWGLLHDLRPYPRRQIMRLH